MEKRKERILSATNSQIHTIKDIAEALKRTSMVSGKIALLANLLTLVGRGRTVSLLAGPSAKKRKLNEFLG